MRCLSIGAVLFALAFGAQAQKLYRCGNNFSQIPCGTQAKPMYRCGGAASEIPCLTEGRITEAQTKPANSERVEAMKSACAAWLRTVPAWKDRDSLKIGNVVRGKHEVIDLHDVPVVVVSYLTTINGKNSYGAYVGERLAVCYANEHENKILKATTSGD